MAVKPSTEAAGSSQTSTVFHRTELGLIIGLTGRYQLVVNILNHHQAEKVLIYLYLLSSEHTN